MKRLQCTDPAIRTLIEDHPLIFQGRPPRLPSSLPPGWLQLTSELLSTLSERLSPAELQLVEVLQIKEKLGTLRIRLDLSKLGRGQQESVRLMISHTEKQALATCQTCGSSMEADAAE